MDIISHLNYDGSTRKLVRIGALEQGEHSGGPIADLELLAMQIAEIEEACFGDAWTKEMIVSSLVQSCNHVFLLCKQGRLCGYLIANMVAGETELLRVAVLPQFRREGVGQMLLESYLSYANAGCERGLLEVRHGNVAAKHLYEKNGYHLFATRKNYYKNPVEDADMYEKLF